MPSLYNIQQDAMVANSFVELGITQSFPATKLLISASVSQSSTLSISDSPSNHANLRWWFKADGLTGSYSQSQAIASWPNSASGFTGESMTLTGIKPTLDTGSISGSIFGQNEPTVRFSGSVGTTPSTLNTNGTLMVMARNCRDTIMNDGVSSTLQRETAQNDYFLYNGSIGSGGGFGVTLSGSVTQSILMTFVFNGGAVTGYEGKYTRGTRGPNISLNRFVPDSFANIAEICMWSRALTQAEIYSLHDNYFRQKYFFEPMYEVAPVVTQSFQTNILARLNNLQVMGQLVEESSFSNQFSIGVNGNVKTRCFSETGVGAIPLYDPVVTSWSSRVVTNGGSAPSANTKAALTTFYRGLAAAGLSSKMKAVNCFVPDNLIASITPLIKTFGNDPWTNTNFVEGDLTIDGLKGNGSNKRLSSGVNPVSAFSSDNSAGISAYQVTGSSSQLIVAGCQTNTSTHEFNLYVWEGASAFFGCWDNGSSRVYSSATPNAGFFSGNRIGANDSKIYYGSLISPVSQVGTNTNASSYTRTNYASGCGVFCTDGDTGQFFYNDGRMSFVAFHDGLTLAETATLFGLVKSMRQQLGGGYV